MLFKNLLFVSVCFQQSQAFLSPALQGRGRSSLVTLNVKPNEYKKGKKSSVTVKDIIDRVTKDAKKLEQQKAGKNNSNKNNRTRRRKERPQQTYLYAAQRKSLEKSGVMVKTKTSEDGEDSEDEETEEENRRVEMNQNKNNPITIAREFGLNPQVQTCDASYAVVYEEGSDDEKIRQLIPSEQPRIMNQLKVGGDDSEGSSSMFGYILYKPAGWSILEKKNKNKKLVVSKNASKTKNAEVSATKSKKDLKKKKRKEQLKAKYYNKDEDEFDTLEFKEEDLLSMMTPEEIGDFEEDGGFDALDLSDAGAIAAKTAMEASAELDDDDEIAALVEGAKTDFYESQGGAKDGKNNIKNNSEDDSPATFLPESKPSVVSWLKNLKAAEGTPIRGGKFWVAVAGAVEVDDSGLLFLCPKDKVENAYVDYVEYAAVVGNGKYLRPKGKIQQVVSKKQSAALNQSEVEVVAKLRKGREDDIVLTTKVHIPDGASTSNDAVQVCQQEFSDGVRGDAQANPLERRANRRLVHCSSLSVSSLTQDDIAESIVPLPDDIKVLADRRNHHEFKFGSFLGRSLLKDSEHTNTFREINGAADGFPGWIVDRYDKWLFVQHDEDYLRGPLPSLHDGSTLGIYYFSTERDRSVTGAKKGIKPMLLEGQPAPDMIPVKENGITYHVNFNDLSTGIFLDQRAQRAWLAQFCTSETKVLNCFSHCGAFSIAAATAGAETVSLDLDKKWLDRVKPQLEANFIDSNDDRHDCIYGDCFDWLRRLGKRGSKFDIVILDPPSTSVGGKKKKRWSAKNDYDELVSLAAPLVKKGGLLWTTTNSNQIHPVKFARQCKKGLVSANLPNAKLERIATMPADFPSIGPQSVKNFVWRII